MIKAGIIGATGYAGAELVRILMGHKEVEIVWYGSRSYIDQKYASVYHNMFEIVDATCLDDNMEALCEQVDVIFTATPQGFLASVLTEKILSKTKIVDLSADFRIKDVATYEKWYKIEHKSPQFIEEAVYGLCEINRDKVKGARLVANPGCYTRLTPAFRNANRSSMENALFCMGMLPFAFTGSTHYKPLLCKGQCVQKSRRRRQCLRRRESRLLSAAPASSPCWLRSYRPEWPWQRSCWAQSYSG